MNYINLESRTQTLEQNFKNEEDFNAYNLAVNVYDKKGESAKIHSKCEYGEKSTKFFLNLGKQKG